MKFADTFFGEPLTFLYTVCFDVQKETTVVNDCKLRDNFFPGVFLMPSLAVWLPVVGPQSTPSQGFSSDTLWKRTKWPTAPVARKRRKQAKKANEISKWRIKEFEKEKQVKTNRILGLFWVSWEWIYNSCKHWTSLNQFGERKKSKFPFCCLSGFFSTSIC